MKVLLVALAVTVATAAAAAPQFAGDIPRGVGYGAVFKLTTDKTGVVTGCSLSEVVGFASTAPLTDIKPSKAYVADGCRKLSSARWRPVSYKNGKIQPVFYFCRYVPKYPDKAFCEKRFGK